MNKTRRGVNRYGLRFSVFLIALSVGFVSNVFAEGEPAAEPVAASAVVAQEANVPATAESAQTASPGNVTIDFKDADIQNVLRIISLKSGVNIIAGKDVTGTVTMRLVNVPWEKALDMVLKTYGYAYDRDGNIIRVTTLENLKREDLSTEVFTLSYADAAQVEKSVKDVLSERGKVRSDSRANMVIVTDMPTTLQRVAKVIENIDKATPQVVIQSKIIEITLGNADRLGIKWSTRVSANGSLRPWSFPWGARQRTGYDRFLPDGTGTSTSSTTTTTGTTTTTESDFPAATRANQPTFPLADADLFRFGTLDASELSALAEMISERNDAKILSEPHITTLNKQEAKILVGEIIGIPTFERNTTTGKMEITGYEDRDLGIRLAVTPQINNQNEIVVTIEPEITSLIGFDTLTTDIKAPRFSSRSAKTQVRIKDGQTIAIGGLIRENTIETNTKIPLLGDVPYVGKLLFNFKDSNTQKTDLLFLMTVHVVQNDRFPQGHGKG